MLVFIDKRFYHFAVMVEVVKCSTTTSMNWARIQLKSSDLLFKKNKNKQKGPGRYGLFLKERLLLL